MPAAVGPAAPPQAPRVLVDGQRHYWFDIELGSSTLGTWAVGADLHAELPHQWLVTAGVHSESSDAFDFGSQGQEYDFTSYQVLGGKIWKGSGLLATVSVGVA